MDDIFLLEILRGCPKALQNTLLTYTHRAYIVSCKHRWVF